MCRYTWNAEELKTANQITPGFLFKLINKDERDYTLDLQTSHSSFVI